MTPPSQLPGVRVGSPDIAQALDILKNTAYLPQDILHMQALGIDVLFRDGAQAYQALARKGVTVRWGTMSDPKAHAEWHAHDNTVMINQEYRGQQDPFTLYAIAEAINHEAGHVTRQGDGRSSLQEELNCLALNVLAYRAHVAANPAYGAYTQTKQGSRLIHDGVALYGALFFDPDVSHTALVNRVTRVYGDLPAESPDHTLAAMMYARGPSPRVSPWSPYQNVSWPEPLLHRLTRALHNQRIQRDGALADYEAMLDQQQARQGQDLQQRALANAVMYRA